MICIESKNRCCGCSSCGEVCPKQAISFQKDDEGFWYPIVDNEKCVNCGLCEKVCPYLKFHNPRTPITVKAGKSENQDIVLKSSSGGLFTELALPVLEKKGIVVGAAYDEDWGVSHLIVNDKSELYKLRGSKYLQSSLFGVFRKVKTALDKGQEVLFSGTPCQVNGLKNYLRKDYSNLLCVEVICHGVPSPKVWKDYLDSYVKKKGRLKSITFRDKRQGWLKYGFCAQYYDNKELYERRDRNLYLKGFLSDVFLRPSCYNCPSKEGRSNADITLGDYWGVSSRQPDAYDNNGTGVALIYTKKGLDYINSIACVCVEAEYDTIRRENPMLIRSTSFPDDRNVFWLNYKTQSVGAVAAAIRRRMPSLRQRLFNLSKLLLNRIRTKY